MIKGLTPDVLIARARAALSGGAVDTAMELLDRVAQLQPGYADVHYMRGLGLARQGRHQQAVSAFDAALAINGLYVDAHVNRALSLRALHRNAEADAADEHAASCAGEQNVDRYPPGLSALLANMHAEVGDRYAESGFLLEATEQYRRACEIRPEFVDIRNRLACTLIALGIRQGAIRELQTAVEHKPHYAAARQNLARIEGRPDCGDEVEMGSISTQYRIR